MAIVVTNVGELILLDDLMGGGENWTLKLIKTGTSITATSEEEDFTECDFAGYAAKTLTRGAWTAASTVEGAAIASYATQTFTCSTGSQSVVGYIVVGATSGELIFGEIFSSAKTITDTVQLAIVPVFTLASAN